MKTITKITLSGLAALVLSTSATAAETDASAVQLELFAHNQGVLAETKVSGTFHEVTYTARNRLLVSYEGIPQEFLLQEISAPFIFGIRPAAQAVLKEGALFPQAGLQYKHKEDNFFVYSHALWRFQEEPLVELRVAGACTFREYAIDAENFLWITAKQLAGTARAHAGYNIASFQIGIAGELAYPVISPVVGIYGRVKF